METFERALITGASGGIGAAFARELARRGTDLILVARSADKLAALAEQLRSAHGRRVDVIVDDLSVADAGVRIKRQVDALGVAVDLLVNNAGFGTMGRFAELSPAREQEEIRLNVAALVDLTHAFLPSMLAARRGAVINIASAAAFQPLPNFAVYAASKAFVVSFSEALWVECRGSGVHVMSVCPGPVDTGFFEATGNDKARKVIPKGMMVDADVIVTASLAGLRARRSLVTPGVMNALSSSLSRMLPGKWVALMVARATGGG